MRLGRPNEKAIARRYRSELSLVQKAVEKSREDGYERLSPVNARVAPHTAGRSGPKAAGAAYQTRYPYHQS